MNAVVRRLAARAPIDPGTDPALEAALERADWDADSRTLRAAALTLALAATALAASIAFFSRPAGALLFFLGVSLAAGLCRLPHLQATLARTRADGDGPAFVCRATLGVALHGTPEAAVDAATTGLLGDELAGHLAAAHGDAETGWDRFTASLADRAPAFARSLALVDAATDAPPDERDRLLDAAVATARRATRERFAAYATRLHGPVSGVYAFGVVLPLALVGVLPVLPSAGAALSPVALAVGYDLALPLGLVAAGAWLVTHRPLAVPAPRVPADHPAIPDTSRRPLAAGLLAAFAGWAAWAALAPDAAPVAALGAGLGSGLLVFSRPREAIRERYEAVLAGLPAATTAAAGALVAGDPPESALAAAGTVHGATGDLFADAASRSRRLSLPPGPATSGPYGVLADGTLPAVARTTDLVVAAADAGPRGGRVLRDYADTRRDLHGLAADLRAELGHTTGTLRTTGRFFAPGIAGVTVALASHVHALGTASAFAAASARPPSLSTGALALTVGGYALWLAGTLPVLAAGLEGPLDATAVAGEAGRGLAAASLVFPTALLAASRLV